MERGAEYIQTKIRTSTTRPFIGIGALGLWYGFCLKSEIDKWKSACASASLGSNARDMAAFTEHPRGLHVRRVLSDGTLLKVYDDRNQIIEDSLLPVVVPGQNLTLLELVDLVPFLQRRGGFRCRFAVKGLAHTGVVVEGDHYCAAWSDGGRAFLFETEKGKHPNAKILERL